MDVVAAAAAAVTAVGETRKQSGGITKYTHNAAESDDNNAKRRRTSVFREFATEPGLQAWHGMRGSLDTVLPGHGVQMVPETSGTVPTSHTSHTPALRMVPSGHGVHSLAPMPDV